MIQFPQKCGTINHMKHVILTILLFANITWTIHADNNRISENRSRRSSICSILVKHDEQKFADEIERQFALIPVSERFYDHNLAVRVVNAGDKQLSNQSNDDFIINNKIASRLVARWFDRNILTGECTLDTVRTRGLYDASTFERELAQRSARGLAMLEDAGEDLIGHTFLLLNEVNYVDKSKRSQTWATIGGMAMGILMAAGGASASDVTQTAQNTASIIASYKGFSVKIRTRLYRLIWNSEISNKFFSQCYSSVEDSQKLKAFENMRSDFKMEYMGEVVSKGGRTSFLGIKEDQPEVMIRKACARAIDENIVDLQHKFEPFRIKTPIMIRDNQIIAPIGLKEGVTSTSIFEVLEPREKNGKTEYHRIGTVKPVATKIWDNRFMADAEGIPEAGFGATSFVKISGDDFYSGFKYMTKI